MTIPPRSNDRENLPESSDLSPEDRRQVVRAASLRPINLLMLVLGGFAGIFISWWFLPLAVVTYSLLVFLATRDPFFKRQALGERAPSNESQSALDISPERRARWIPRGETRQKIEETLGVYRRVVTAIEESDDVSRSVLEDTVPKLHSAADRLVEAGTNREKASTAISELKSLSTDAERTTSIEELENIVQKADKEISNIYEKFVELRAKIARISTSDTPENRSEASQVNESLNEITLRLEALEETMTLYEEIPTLSESGESEPGRGPEDWS